MWCRLTHVSFTPHWLIGICGTLQSVSNTSVHLLLSLCCGCMWFNMLLFSPLSHLSEWVSLLPNYSNDVCDGSWLYFSCHCLVPGTQQPTVSNTYPQLQPSLWCDCCLFTLLFLFLPPQAVSHTPSSCSNDVCDVSWLLCLLSSLLLGMRGTYVTASE